MTGYAARLGDWVASLTPDAAGAERLDRMRGHLLDTLGVMVAGASSEVASIARRVYDAPGDAVVLAPGRGAPNRLPRRSPVDAAKCNAVAAHALELDDTEGCDHTGAVVVPALLAAADASPIRPSGSHLLTAMVAGYEVGRRVQNALGGYDAHNSSGWHSTATCGVFAAAAACAKLLGLTAEQTVHAIGLAASSSGGTWAFAADGALAKRFHPAFAAGAGLEATLLAGAGITGPAAIFEDVWGGVFRTHGNPTSDPAELARGLGHDWHADHSAIKLYACCRSAHATLDGVIDLVQSGELSEALLVGADLRLSPFLANMICPEPLTGVDAARMSLPTGIALALINVPLSPEAFERFEDDDVVELRSRIRVHRDPAATIPHLVIRTAGGEEQVVSREFARGSSEVPIDREMIRAKFGWVTEPHLDPADGAALARFVEQLGDARLPEIPDLSARG